MQHALQLQKAGIQFNERRHSRSWSRSGVVVQLPFDQNITGDESEATPFSGQQGSKTSREDDRPVRDNRVAEAPRKSLGGSALFRPWDMWIQHAFQLKERMRKQHISDWRQRSSQEDQRAIQSFISPVYGYGSSGRENASQVTGIDHQCRHRSPQISE